MAAPETAVSGQSATITWQVTNQGAGVTGDGTPDGTVGSWTDQIVLSQDSVFGNADDVVVANVPHTGSLGAGESYDGTWTGALPFGIFGDYHVFVFADQGNAVYEYTDPHSNVAEAAGLTTVIRAFADLTVDTMVAPATVAAGGQLPVSWTVTNTSNAVAATPVSQWYDYVVLSQDSVFGNADDQVIGQFVHNGTLAMGASYDAGGNVAMPGGLAGAYYLFVVTDATDAVFEFNYEDNNVSAAAPLQVQAPDLQVSGLTVTGDPALQSGAMVTIGWNDFNSGDGATAATGTIT